jgi:K+-transporting ATPase A subunit
VWLALSLSFCNQFPAILLLSNLVIRSKSIEALFPRSSSKIHLSAFSRRFQGKTRRFRGLGWIWQKLVEFILQAYSPPSRPLALILSVRTVNNRFNHKKRSNVGFGCTTLSLPNLPTTKQVTSLDIQTNQGGWWDHTHHNNTHNDAIDPA